MASRLRVLAAASLYHAANDGTVAVLFALLPVLRLSLNFGYVEIGTITASALAVAVVFQIIFGALSDRWRRGPMLALGVAILGIASLLITQASSYAVLLGLVLFARVGSSFYHPIGIGWVSSSFHGERLDRAMGFQSGMGDLGVIAAYVTGALLVIPFGWPAPFLVWGLVSVGAALGGFILTGTAAPSPRPMTHPPDLRALLRDVRLWILPLAVGGAAYTVTNAFGPVFLVDVVHLSEAQAPLVIALWLGVGVVAALGFGRITRLVNRYNALSKAFLVIALAGLVLGLVPQLPVVIATFVAFGMALFITYPALFSFISETTGAKLQGTTFGIVFAFQLLGGAVAGYASGLMASVFEKGAPFLLIAALGFLTFFVLEAFRSTFLREEASRVQASRGAEPGLALGDPGHSRGR